MLVAIWAELPGSEPRTFVAHLHGRDLAVAQVAGCRTWRWSVATPHGSSLAGGTAPDRWAAEQAAEDEATAVHPPTERLIDVLLG